MATVGFVSVQETDVEVVGSGGARVPCRAWLPRDARGVAVILLGHGGSNSKSSARNDRMGRWFAGRGVAAVAIDGPFHGGRISHPIGPETYQAEMVRLGMHSVIDGMTRDWQAAVDTVVAGYGVDGSRLGYLGLSMGSRFGIPLVAALGPRFRAAVFGKFGLVEAVGATGVATPELHRECAGQITVPVLLHLQWDDQVFPRHGALDLFDAFGSRDKTLVARPGSHADTHPRDERCWQDFLLQHL